MFVRPICTESYLVLTILSSCSRAQNAVVRFIFLYFAIYQKKKKSGKLDGMNLWHRIACKFSLLCPLWDVIINNRSFRSWCIVKPTLCTDFIQSMVVLGNLALTCYFARSAFINLSSLFEKNKKTAEANINCKVLFS